MTLRQIIDEKRDEIPKIAAKHGATNIRLFGSVVSRLVSAMKRPPTKSVILIDSEGSGPRMDYHGRTRCKRLIRRPDASLRSA